MEICFKKWNQKNAKCSFLQSLRFAPFLIFDFIDAFLLNLLFIYFNFQLKNLFPLSEQICSIDLTLYPPRPIEKIIITRKGRSNE